MTLTPDVGTILVNGAARRGDQKQAANSKSV
jgi:hypothetical protein